MNCELPDVQAEFRKGRGIRDQIANIRWIIEKAREFQKNIYFCFIDYTKAFDTPANQSQIFGTSLGYRLLLWVVGGRERLDPVDEVLDGTWTLFSEVQGPIKAPCTKSQT